MPYITCKPCGKRLERLEWMQNKTCENPNCRCPEVMKIRQAANDVINKAKEGTNYQKVVRHTIPTGYDEDVKQYMVDVPDVMVVEITVPRGRKRK